MALRSSNGLEFLQFDSMLDQPILHAIFTREGGVSPAPWSSLNVGGTVGDDDSRVRTNRQRAFRALDRDPASVYDVWQIHSAEYVIAEQPRDDHPHVKADILLTANPAVTLFMRFADCVPILLYDTRKHVIALAHAGWLGSVNGAALSAVAALERQFGSSAADIHAGLGPSIGPDHYEVGEEVRERYAESFPESVSEHFVERGGRIYMNLWRANESQLRSTGIEHIEQAGICTACDLSRWFSHRAEGGKTGRFGAMLALNAL